MAAGDAARAAVFTIENPKQAGIALSSVFIDRLLGLLAIFGIAGFALLTNISLLAQHVWLRLIGVLLVIMTLIGLAVIAALASRRRRNAVEWAEMLGKLPFHNLWMKLMNGFRAFRGRPGVLAKGFLISCLGHTSMILAIYILAERIGIQLDGASAYVFAISVGIIAAMIPVSGPAGIGVGNAGFAVTFGLVGSNDGAELAVIWQVTFIVASQIGLLFFLIGRRREALSAPSVSGMTEHKSAVPQTDASPIRNR